MSENIFSRGFYKFVAVLALVQGLLIFAPLSILGAAIDWPASLDAKASDILPKIHQNIDAVRTGYFIYFIYSVLFFIVAGLIAFAVNKNDKLKPILLIGAIAAGVSSLARTIGIIRWLGGMPYIASEYVKSGVTDVQKQMLEYNYNILNTFGGNIGEVLGVSIFAMIWVLCVSIYLIKNNLFKLQGYAGVVVAIFLFLPVFETLGFTLPSFTIALSTTLIQLWFLAWAVILFRHNPEKQK